MNRQFLKQVIFFSILNLLLLFAINYVIDPLQVYRPQTTLKPLYTEEQRLQVPGLINSFANKAKVALVGSSMTSNFSHELVEEVYNKPLIKLSIDGSTPYEQLFVVNKLLESEENSIQTVIWGLDVVRFNAYYGEFSQPKDIYPFYLYNKKWMDTLKYSINIDTFIHSLQTLFASTVPISFIRKRQDLKVLNLWQHKKGCNVVFDNYQDVLPAKSWLDSINENFHETAVRSYMEDISATASKYPHITFELFFPPHPILRYKFLDQKNKLKLTMKLRNYIAGHLASLPNVNFYDPASRKELILQLDHYKDLGHYDGFMNKQILNMISNQQMIKSRQEIQLNTKNLAGIVANYDFSTEEQECRERT